MNGWMVVNYRESHGMDGCPHCEIFVYEDMEPEDQDFFMVMAGASSLQALLWDHFDYYLRSEKIGGLELTLHKKGKECE